MAKNKTPTDLALDIAQSCISQAPVLILGSGASAAYGVPGMPELRNHILSTALPTNSSPQELDAWQTFINHLDKTDLETALTKAHLPDTVTRLVVGMTWDLLVPHDIRVFEATVRDRGNLSLTKLYQHLFKSTHTAINVVTPNYDRLAEYAADAGGLCHYTGFNYGHLRLRAKDSEPRIYVDKSPVRTVKIWKVHGSLDWFKDQNDIVMALPVSGTRPSGMEPVIVTPGVEKYRLTHDEPFLSIKRGADSALQSARSYLCVGYGFNDTHVQTKLVERCQVESVSLVLITRGLTPNARSFLKSGKCRRYLALERSGTGSRMYSTEYPDGTGLSDKPYWQLDQFLTMVTP